MFLVHHLLALLMAATLAGQTVAEQVWTLRVDDPDPIVVTAWSSNEQCIAVATATTVRVFDRAGRPLWQWNFRQATRFLHPRWPGQTPLAISPLCDAVAIGGMTDYRYVWIADRQGRRAAFNTIGTIGAVRFDLRGQTVAVSTGASRGYLINPQLTVRWTGPLVDLPVTWPGERIDGPSVSRPEFLKDDVDHLFGVAPWGLGIRDSVSDDGQRRVVETMPYRGPVIGMVMFFGPHAGSFRPRVDWYRNSPQPRWSIPFRCPEVTITSDGEFVLVSGDPDHADNDTSGNDCSLDDPERYVFDQNGTLVLKWPATGDPSELADAVLRRTGKRLNLPDTGQRWHRDTFDDFLDQLASERDPPIRTQHFSADYQYLLASRDRELRLYRKPQR